MFEELDCNIAVLVTLLSYATYTSADIFVKWHSVGKV